MGLNCRSLCYNYHNLCFFFFFWSEYRFVDRKNIAIQLFYVVLIHKKCIKLSFFNISLKKKQNSHVMPFCFDNVAIIKQVCRIRGHELNTHWRNVQSYWLRLNSIENSGSSVMPFSAQDEG